MKRNHSAILTLSFILFLNAVMITGCGIPELKSRWRDREINIDGLDAEWGNFIQYYHEKTRVILCMFNDESYLYIKVSSPNRTMQRQLMAFGLTVWFDPEGGRKKTFGINFTTGMQDKAILMTRDGKRTRNSEDSEQFKKIIEESQSELKILGSNSNESRIISMSDAEKLGISVRIGKPNASLVYELKIPLAKSEQHLYAIGAGVAETIGIGFETGKKDVKRMPGAGDREMNGTGKRSSGIGGRDSGRGGSRGMSRDGGLMPESLDLWTKVTLASNN